MAASRGIFDFNSLSPALKQMLPRIDAAVSIAFDAREAKAESYARENAQWTDRTGNARNGLQAKHVAVPMVVHRLVVFHTMPYGIFLEVRWSGKYAIIGPTIFNTAPELTALVTAAVQRAIRSI